MWEVGGGGRSIKLFWRLAHASHTGREERVCLSDPLRDRPTPAATVVEKAVAETVVEKAVAVAAPTHRLAWQGVFIRFWRGLGRFLEAKTEAQIDV